MYVHEGLRAQRAGQRFCPHEWEAAAWGGHAIDWARNDRNDARFMGAMK